MDGLELLSISSLATEEPSSKEQNIANRQSQI